jgi:hypothetical protein
VSPLGRGGISPRAAAVAAEQETIWQQQEEEEQQQQQQQEQERAEVAALAEERDALLVRMTAVRDPQHCAIQTFSNSNYCMTDTTGLAYRRCLCSATQARDGTAPGRRS